MLLLLLSWPPFPLPPFPNSVRWPVPWAFFLLILLLILLRQRRGAPERDRVFSVSPRRASSGERPFAYTVHWYFVVVVVIIVFYSFVRFSSIPFPTHYLCYKIVANRVENPQVLESDSHVIRDLQTWENLPELSENIGRDQVFKMAVQSCSWMQDAICHFMVSF